MKIVSPYDPLRNRGLRSSKKDPIQGAAFSKIMEAAESDDSFLDGIFSNPDKILENLFLLAEEVDKAGNELAERPTPQNYFTYKKYVGLVLKGAVRNMEISERVVQIPLKRRQMIYKTAQEIDEVLADLARRILNDEKNRIDILQLTGHLKGLIVCLLA